jgi:hypothetical protein
MVHRYRLHTLLYTTLKSPHNAIKYNSAQPTIYASPGHTASAILLTSCSFFLISS